VKLRIPAVGLLPLDRYAALLGAGRMQEISVRLSVLRAMLAGRVVWNVSSTLSGGGVAEILNRLVPLMQELEIGLRSIAVPVKDAAARCVAAINVGLPRGIVNADSAFGNNTAFRDGVTRQGLRYAVGIQETTTVWPSGKGPLAPPASKTRGRRAKLLRRDQMHQPVTARQLADQWGRDCFRSIVWREGSRGEMRSHFCAERVRPAHQDYLRETPRPEEWLLIEWPEAQSVPTKYYLSTLKQQTSLRKLVYEAKGRWPIERDYEELKDMGLGHYEVRGWRGFHHHAMMSIAAYAFLIMGRGLFSPGRDHRQSRWAIACVSGGGRSDISAYASGKAQSNFDCDNAYRIRRDDGQPRTPMPILPKIERPHVIIS